jgi:hypothetical protein
VVRGCPQAISDEKGIEKILTNSEIMKIVSYMSMLKVSLLVDFQQKVGE